MIWVIINSLNGSPIFQTISDTVGSFFNQVHDIDLVRIWLFEGLEGLIFDDNNELVSIERTFLES